MNMEVKHQLQLNTVLPTTGILCVKLVQIYFLQTKTVD